MAPDARSIANHRAGLSGVLRVRFASPRSSFPSSVGGGWQGQVGATSPTCPSSSTALMPPPQKRRPETGGDSWGLQQPADPPGGAGDSPGRLSGGADASG